MTYDLWRVRLRGLIERVPGTHRYTVTEYGLRIALFYTRTHARPALWIGYDLQPRTGSADSSRFPSP